MIAHMVMAGLCLIAAFVCCAAGTTAHSPLGLLGWFVGFAFFGFAAIGWIVSLD